MATHLVDLSISEQIKKFISDIYLVFVIDFVLVDFIDLAGLVSQFFIKSTKSF